MSIRDIVKFNYGIDIGELPTKAVELIKTVSSGKVDEDTYTQRLNSCNLCPAKEQIDNKIYCKDCGCPNWRLAELTHKLRFVALVCPRKRPGFHRSPIMKDSALKLAPVEFMKEAIKYAKTLIESNLVPLASDGDQEADAITDYNTAKPDFSLKNKITLSELNTANQKMTEALKTENFVEGFMLAIQLILIATK